jgi:hypothetical protein
MTPRWLLALIMCAGMLAGCGSSTPAVDKDKFPPPPPQEEKPTKAPYSDTAPPANPNDPIRK